MTDTKIKAMHRFHGKDHQHKCKDCCNLIEKYWQRKYHKCLVYGDSNAPSTDWAKSYVACGHFDIPFDPDRENEVRKLVRGGRRDHNAAVEGQIDFVGVDLGMIEGAGM